MILKPQDIYILLKLVAMGESQWSYASVAGDLIMSASEVHAGDQAGRGRLIDACRRANRFAFDENLTISAIHRMII